MRKKQDSTVMQNYPINRKEEAKDILKNYAQKIVSKKYRVFKLLKNYLLRISGEGVVFVRLKLTLTYFR